MSENKSKLVIAIHGDQAVSENRSITVQERFAASERRLCLRLQVKCFELYVTQFVTVVLLYCFVYCSTLVQG
jgi:hypothetical protein